MNAPLPAEGLAGRALALAEKRPAFDIRAERHGAKTFLASQFVTYPFHLTRLFRLDEAVPEIATLYMQSSSGGLYAGDDHTLRVHVGAGAALHLTTQGSTIVQGHGGRAARLAISVTVAAGGFFAYTPDPQILFPGSASDTALALDLAEDAVAILTDGFLLHDPRQAGAVPVSFRSVVEASVGGRRVFTDRQHVSGAALGSTTGPLRGHRVCGSLLAFGLADGFPMARLGDSLLRPDVLAGATTLAGGCGVGARILATDGAAFQGAVAAGFAAGFAARFGLNPAPRRK